MKAIKTKYLGCTNARPSYIKASAEGVKGKLYTVSSLEELQLAGNESSNLHQLAARQFCRERNWTGTLASGGTENPDVWVHCFVDPRNLTEI